jgi:hypothetical protein
VSSSGLKSRKQNNKRQCEEIRQVLGSMETELRHHYKESHPLVLTETVPNKEVIQVQPTSDFMVGTIKESRAA